jgi:hypothetical protein
MKYIKLFEEKDDLELNDYVICFAVDEEDDETLLNDFLKFNIGRYVGIEPKQMKKDRDAYIVEFDHVPKEVGIDFSSVVNKNQIFFDRFEIIKYSKNKEDLEHFVQANKYNL